MIFSGGPDSLSPTLWIRPCIMGLEGSAASMDQPIAHWTHSTRVLGGQTSVPVPKLYNVPEGSVADHLQHFMNDIPDNIKSDVRLSVDEGLSCLRKIYPMRETRHQHHIQIQLIIHYTTKPWKCKVSKIYWYNINWSQHISIISFTATKKFSVPRRNLAFAFKITKEVAYITLVRP